MKSRLIASLFLLCVPLLCGSHIFHGPPCPGRVTSGGVTLKQALGSTGGTNLQFCNASGREYMAVKFTAGWTGTLTRVDVEMKANNSPTGVISCYAYSHNSGGNSPASLLTNGTATNTVDSATLTTSFVYREFDFTPISITSGTVYWILVYKVTQSGTNYAYINSTTSTGRIDRSPDASTWTYLSTTQEYRVNLYGT